MVKKSRNLILIALCAIFALFAASCGKHEHSYADGWKYDSEYHWRVATCGDIDIDLKAKHNYVDGICTLCGYNKNDPEHPVDPDDRPTDDPDTPDTPDTPDNPDTPDQPDNPDTPDQPDNPDTPDQPDNPDTPDQPDNPDTPDQPDNPDTPDQPDNPDNPGEQFGKYTHGQAESSEGLVFTELFDDGSLVGYSVGKGEDPVKGKISIPDSYKEKPVLEIDEFGFENCTELVNITLPQTLETIGLGAFSGCTALSAIEIPENVTLIDMQAFSNCSSLKSVKMPKFLESIPYETFYKCAALEEMIIPEGVKSIEKMAFYGCRKLIYLSLPSTLTTLGKEAFNACEIVKVSVFDVNLWSTMDFPDDACNPVRRSQELYEKDQLITELKIDAEKVSAYAFEECSSIQKVVLSSSVQSIGKYAFSNCRFLKEVEFGEGLKTIGSYAFYYCYGIQSVSLPDSVETVEEEAFMFCQGLEKFVFGRGIKMIAGYALGNNSRNLTVYYRGSESEWKSVTKVGNWCFRGPSTVEYDYKGE